MTMTTNSTGTGNPVTGPSEGLNAAASAFEALMAPPPEDKPEDDEANAEATEEPASQANEEAEEPSDEEPAEQATEEGESGDEEQEEAAPAAEVFTVKVDGKEIEVGRDELLAGYSRTSDYTRKTQQIAEERKALQAEAESIRAQRDEYGKLLPKLRASLEAGLGPEPDWNTLRQQDPARAAVLWQMREEARRHVEAVKADEDRIAAERAQQEAEAQERRVIEERNSLLEKLPEWRKQEVAEAEAAAIRKLMEDTGFAEDEIQLTDHRYVLIARKAAKYDELMSKSGDLKSKASKAPVVKPGGGVPKKSSPMKESQSRLRKTGSVKDAADWFANAL